MARFFDELRVDSKVESRLQHIPVIAADNVQDYVVSIGYVKSLDLTRNLPLTPPFEDCFIEYRNVLPPMDVSCGHFIHREKTDTGWNVLVTTFMRYRRDKPVLTSVVEFDLHQTGEISGELTLHHLALQTGDYQEFTLTILSPMFLTLVFLNTQKVERLETVPPEKLSKRHQKKYGAPLTKFYTLKVNAVNARPAAKEHQGGNHQSPAHHIVRGHFRRYTEEAPLFGKWAGVYWWGEFERGKKERGEVTKDYEVIVDET
jgi:hypothetical protein